MNCKINYHLLIVLLFQRDVDILEVVEKIKQLKYNNYYQIWDLKTKPTQSPLVCSLKGHSGGITALTFGADEGYIISANYSGELLAHNLQQKKLSSTLQHINPVKTIRCLHNSTFKKHYIVSGNDAGDVDLWDCRTGQV